MAAVHEVIARDGACLYRGCDVELACEIYEAAPAGARLRCSRAWTAADERRQRGLGLIEIPVPYALTPAGYAATSPRGRGVAAPDEPVPYALTERAADLFVVDTTDVADLRRRCPELFAVRRRSDLTTRAAVRPSRTTSGRERMDV